MEAIYNVIFTVRKGAGPRWDEKVIPIGLDDLPADLQEWEIIEMAKAEAKNELHRLGYHPATYIYQDTQKA